MSFVNVSDLFIEEMNEIVEERFQPMINIAVEMDDYQYSAPRNYKMKLRFNCPDCDNRWTSSKGTTVIHHELI